jgi:hypothetical protein
MAMEEGLLLAMHWTPNAIGHRNGLLRSL